MSPAPAFSCTICAEESVRICIWCSKDTCESHLCGRCRRCSDCCPCERPLPSDAAAPADNPR